MTGHSSSDSDADAPPVTVPDPIIDMGGPAKLIYLALRVTDTPLCPGDMVDGLGLSQTAVTSHLRNLREAGVVKMYYDPDDRRIRRYTLRADSGDDDPESFIPASGDNGRRPSP